VPTIVEELVAVVGADISTFKSGILKVTNLSGRAGKSMAKAGKIGFIAFTGLGIASLKFASDFDKAMAEVDTIAGQSVEQMQVIRKEILALSDSMGKDPTKLAKGFYQTISAGITNTSDAMLVMRKSTKLAIAGLASQETTVDVVTSALNAYNLSATEAERVTDALFTTVKLGKTRLEPLAASLGRILPIAAQLNTEIEEVGAAIVALTAAGLSTQEATTGLRQLFVSILKPTQEAAAEAQRVGLAWDVAAIKATGFSAVMADLKEKLAEGNIDIAKLIPNVRALPSALILAGNGSEKFTNAMKEMLKNTGVTNEAFEKMEKTLSRKLEKALAGIRVAFIEIGTTLTPVAVDMLKWIRETAKGVAGFIRTNPKLVAGTVKWGIAISGVTFALGKLIAASKTLIAVYGVIAASSVVATLKTTLLTGSVGGLTVAMKGLSATVGGLALLKVGMLAFGAAAAVAFAGFKAGQVIFDKAGKSLLESDLAFRRNARERTQELKARETFARGFATRQLKRAGMIDIEKKGVKQITQIYKVWVDTGNELSGVLGRLGVDQQKIDDIRANSTIPQIKEMLVLAKKLHKDEVTRQVIIKDNLAKVSQLTIEQVRLTEQSTDTARELYDTLTNKVEEYQDAVKDALKEEERLATQRRRFGEDARTSLIELQQSRVGGDAGEQAAFTVSEAKRAQRLAAKATKAGDLVAAKDFRARSKDLFEKAARDQIRIEKNTQREITKLRKKLVGLGDTKTTLISQRIAAKQLADARRRDAAKKLGNDLADAKRRDETLSKAARKRREKAGKETVVQRVSRRARERPGEAAGESAGQTEKRFAKRRREIAAEEAAIRKQIATLKTGASETGTVIDTIFNDIKNVNKETLNAITDQQAAAAKATEEAKLNLADLQNQIELLKMTASELSINLETQTAQERLDELVTKFRAVKAEITGLNQQTAQVQVAGAQARAQVIPGVVAPATAGSMVNNVTQTVNVTGITDPDAVAKEVERILFRREQRRQVRTRRRTQ